MCEHEWRKTTSEPKSTYITYGGEMVGVFRCKCVKCGKEKNKKYLKESGLIRLSWA